jgi:hypothetical protein
MMAKNAQVTRRGFLGRAAAASMLPLWFIEEQTSLAKEARPT